MVYDNLLDKILEGNIPSSNYKLPLSQSKYYHMSLIKTRSKSIIPVSYYLLQGLLLPDNNNNIGNRFNLISPS